MDRTITVTPAQADLLTTLRRAQAQAETEVRMRALVCESACLAILMGHGISEAGPWRLEGTALTVALPEPPALPAEG